MYHSSPMSDYTHIFLGGRFNFFLVRSFNNFSFMGSYFFLVGSYFFLVGSFNFSYVESFNFHFIGSFLFLVRIFNFSFVESFNFFFVRSFLHLCLDALVLLGRRVLQLTNNAVFKIFIATYKIFYGSCFTTRRLIGGIVG